MKLYKAQYAALAAAVCFSALGIFWQHQSAEAPNHEAPQKTTWRTKGPVETETRSTENVLHDILDLQSDIFTEREKLRQDAEAFDESKAGIETLAREARQTAGINIFNNVEWYDIPGIFQNWKDRREEEEKLRKESEEKLAELNKLQQSMFERDAKISQMKEKEKDLREELALVRHMDYDVTKQDESLSEIAAVQEHIFSKPSVAFMPPSMSRGFAAPCAGEITSPFGYREHPIYGDTRFHSGVDIGVDYGTPIFASSDGVVFLSEWYGGFGNAVILYHSEGSFTLYGHNDSLLVSEGEVVRRGQPIALAGSTGNSTGPHCHFSMWQNGRLVDPLDYVSIPES